MNCQTGETDFGLGAEFNEISLSLLQDNWLIVGWLPLEPVDLMHTGPRNFSVFSANRQAHRLALYCPCGYR